MKKLFILAVSMSLAFSGAMAQTATEKQGKSAKTTTSGPELTFAEKSHDFGNINQGDVVEYTFKFKNTGNAPLIISNVGVTCGCTATQWPKEPIAPGKSSSITATFNSAGKFGQQNKVITVESNALNSPAQVAIITNIQEKPAAGASIMKPADGPVETKTKIKTKN